MSDQQKGLPYVAGIKLTKHHGEQVVEWVQARGGTARLHKRSGRVLLRDGRYTAMPGRIVCVDGRGTFGTVDLRDWPERCAPGAALEGVDAAPAFLFMCPDWTFEVFSR